MRPAAQASRQAALGTIFTSGRSVGDAQAGADAKGLCFMLPLFQVIALVIAAAG